MSDLPVTKQNLILYKGKTSRWELVFNDDGAAIDISLWIIYLTIKATRNTSDANAVLKKTITTHTDPISGTTEIYLSKTDTNIAEGSYVYSIEYNDGETGTNLDEKPLMEGNLTVIRPVRVGS